MTGTETLEIAYVNPPKAGAKKGSIKTVDGRYFGVWPEKLSLFSPGSVVNVEYESTTGSDGKTYHTIKRVIGPSARPKAAAAATGALSHTKSEEMFVMGLIGRALQGSGTIPDRGTLEMWIKDIRWAWKEGFRDTPMDTNGAASPPFNDDIPF